MTTGYKTLTPIQIGNLLHALAQRQVSWLGARVWFACLEMVAIREAARRVRLQRRDTRRVQSDFKRTEIAELTGLNACAVGRALGNLQRQGLLEFTSSTITVGETPMEEAGETIQTISGGRSARRPIPVPRGVLRFLAAQPTAALGKVMLGYVCRGLSIEREGGALREAGTVKASWLADVLGLSLRSVRYAQAQLRSVHWIGKDTNSKQWKLNRTGAWFRIDLNWKPPMKTEGVASGATNGAPIARPTPDICPSVAPPKEDKKTPSESKNQKPGVFKTKKIRSGCAIPLPAPTLANIRLADLHDRGRLRSLYRQAVARGWVRECQADALNFYAAAVRSRAVGNGDPVRIFVGVVRRRLWHHVTQAQEEEARRCLEGDSSSVRGPGGSCQAVGAILTKLLPPSMVPMPCHRSSPLPQQNSHQTQPDPVAVATDLVRHSAP